MLIRVTGIYQKDFRNSIRCLILIRGTHTITVGDSPGQVHVQRLVPLSYHI